MKAQLNEVKRLQKIAGILKESNKGYDKMEEENQMEAADTSWKSLPTDIEGRYLVKMDWRDNKEHFMNAINAFKQTLEPDVRFGGKFRKGNPNSPNGGVVTIIGDSTNDIINFLASEDGGQMGKYAKEYFDDNAKLRPKGYTI